jgi:hypothetical protein
LLGLLFVPEHGSDMFLETSASFNTAPPYNQEDRILIEILLTGIVGTDTDNLYQRRAPWTG